MIQSTLAVAVGAVRMMWMYRFVMQRGTFLGVDEPCRLIDRIFFSGNTPVLVHGAIFEIQVNLQSFRHPKTNVYLPRFLTVDGEVNVGVG